MENHTSGAESNEREKSQQYILQLATRLLEVQGSEIFVTAGSPPAFKINGVIQRISENKLIPQQTALLVRAVMSEQQWREFEQRRELNFSINFPNFARFMVRAFTQRGSIGMVMRRIQERIPTIGELNLPEVIQELALAERGLVIFIGGTGCGKTTSLAAMLDYRNENAQEHIITIEDPIEFFHSHKQCIVDQREVGTDTDSYESALKNTLRQTPNVLLVGEINSREAMQYVINFAETGRVCFTSLYANNAEQAFDKIINFFPTEKRTQILSELASNLKGMVAQRLLPREDQPGLIPAVEVMINTPLIADLIMQGRINELKAMMVRSPLQGVITFDEALFNLYDAGRISYETAINNAESANNLRLRIRTEGQRARPANLESGLQIEEKQRNWNEF